MTKKCVVPLVIAAGDEGLQLNSGTRFGFAGSGYDLPFFAPAVAALKQILPQPLVLASIQEDDWLSLKLQSKNPNLYQETLAQFAKKNKLKYVGQFDYGDPRDLDDNLTRGHIVRPPKIHVADQICFTIGGGEQKYNLRQLVISADYLCGLTPKQGHELILAQVQFYRQLLGQPLKFVKEKNGCLTDKHKQKNETALDKILATL